MDKEQFDCVVIGSGPGGYVAAIRAAQRGLKTALVESRELGGTCLNRGCIPSKTLIANAEVLRKLRHADQFGIRVDHIGFDYALMKERKDGVVDKIRKGLDGLIRSNKIQIIQGRGRLLSPTEVAVTGQEERILETQKIILATGSEPRELPSIPFDYKVVHDSTSLLNITRLPKKLLVIGGGVIGCEFACLHNAFDVEVTILELLPTLIPAEGKQIAETLTKSFKKRGIRIETEAVIKQVDLRSDGVTIQLTDGRSAEGDMVLVSVGRKYNTDGIGLDKVGVIIEKNGTIPTDAHMQTNVPGIYAIGDITGKWLLAHVASHQGLIAADHASGLLDRKMHYEAVPSVIYTDPEVATVGYTLEKATQAGYEAALGAFPFQALGKSQATLQTEGFAQIVVDKSTGQILGAQVVGYGASTLIAEMAVAIANELTIESIHETIHAHPTVAEAWMEAALLANELPLHLPPRRK